LSETAYHIFKNGVFKEHSTATSYTVADEDYAEYKVSAMDKDGFESFSSEPMVFAKNELLFQFEEFVAASSLPYTNFDGKGFVEISTSKISFPFPEREICCPCKTGFGYIFTSVFI